jgi:hypothetical protein
MKNSCFLHPVQPIGIQGVGRWLQINPFRPKYWTQTWKSLEFLIMNPISKSWGLGIKSLQTRLSPIYFIRCTTTALIKLAACNVWLSSVNSLFGNVVISTNDWLAYSGWELVLRVKENVKLHRYSRFKNLIQHGKGYWSPKAKTLLL